MKFNFDLCTGHHLSSGRAVGEELGPNINSGCSDLHRFCAQLFYLCFVVFGTCGKRLISTAGALVVVTV